MFPALGTQCEQHVLLALTQSIVYGSSHTNKKKLFWQDLHLHLFSNFLKNTTAESTKHWIFFNLMKRSCLLNRTWHYTELLTLVGSGVTDYWLAHQHAPLRTQTHWHKTTNYLPGSSVQGAPVHAKGLWQRVCQSNHCIQRWEHKCPGRIGGCLEHAFWTIFCHAQMGSIWIDNCSRNFILLKYVSYIQSSAEGLGKWIKRIILASHEFTFWQRNETYMHVRNREQCMVACF